MPVKGLVSTSTSFNLSEVSVVITIITADVYCSISTRGTGEKIVREIADGVFRVFWSALENGTLDCREI